MKTKRWLFVAATVLGMTAGSAWKGHAVAAGCEGSQQCWYDPSRDTQYTCRWCGDPCQNGPTGEGPYCCCNISFAE
ncbi:MAG TPA: hypothetical protein VF092_11130 [Longimicrobium sp.]